MANLLSFTVTYSERRSRHYQAVEIKGEVSGELKPGEELEDVRKRALTHLRVFVRREVKEALDAIVAEEMENQSR